MTAMLTLKAKKSSKQLRRWQQPNALHLLLAILLIVAALGGLWLWQLFGKTLMDLTASQLLEQEQQYLQQQVTKSAHAVLALQPSRPYFHITAEPLPLSAQPLAHDDAVFVQPATDNSSAWYRSAIVTPNQHPQATPNTAGAALWLVLDLDRALPLVEFQRLLQGLSFILLVVVGSCAGWLIYRLSSAQRQLQAALQREHNFVNDISHELRTPLSLMQNALKLAEAQSRETEPFQLLQDACNSMTQQLNVLLAIARKQQTALVRLALLPEIEQVMLQLYQSEPAFVSQIVLELPEDLYVYGNPQLIQLLLHNLIGNAIYHSGGAVLRISYHEKKLQFNNKINQLPDSQPQLHRSYQGFGHGSSLIQRIADELCWPIQITADQHNYQVSLQLIASGPHRSASSERQSNNTVTDIKM